MQEDSVKNHINLIKLSVGTETVDDLAAWQEKKQARTSDGFPRHVTRMWPKREPEILNGGSIFWVIKGVIQPEGREHEEPLPTELNRALAEIGVL